MEEESKPRVGRVLLALYGIPIAGNLNIICSILVTLSQPPAGASIRPMGLSMWIVIVAMGTTVLGLVAGCIASVKGFRSIPVLVAGVACMLLSPTTWGVGIGFFRWYAKYRGLVLSN